MTKIRERGLLWGGVVLGGGILAGLVVWHVVREWPTEEAAPAGRLDVAMASVSNASPAQVTERTAEKVPAAPKTAPAPAVPPAPSSAPPPVSRVVPPARPERVGATNAPAARQVRLANRTIGLERGRRSFPKAFAARQTPTARGTAPYVVISELPVSKLVRDRATKLGARVLGFMPVNALVVEVNEKTLRKLAEDPFFAGAYELDPKDKVQEDVRAAAAENPAKVDVTVVPLMSIDREGLETFVREQGGAVIPSDPGDRPRVRARIPAAAVEPLARRGDVRWIERYVPARLQNDVVVGGELMNVRVVWETHGLTGAGQIITTSDSGLDTGNAQTVMADFQDRVVKIRTAPGSLSRDTIGHGTHTAGSLVGNGALSQGQIRGVAHGARLYVWQCVHKDGSLYPPGWADLFQPDERNSPSYIHSASWGYFWTSQYTTECAGVDDYVWRHPENLGVFAAGNYGTSGARTIMDPGGAKNVLAVGATESHRAGYAYPTTVDNPASVYVATSRGPMVDGRIKPDICAPGTGILSTRSLQVARADLGWGAYAANGHYTFNGGTSMATPLVAGAAAVVREWLTTRRGFTNAIPTAALVKAVLLGGAHDLAQDAGADCGGAAPNNRQGWGRLNLGETLYPSNRSVHLVDGVPFAAGSDFVERIVTTNAAPLDVQLVWMDAPGDPAAAQALVNDLDLVVSNETTGVVWFGNGTTGGDRVNTVEGVRVARAEPGCYAIHVKGMSVPYDSSEGGAAALYVRGALEAGMGRDWDAGGRTAVWRALCRRSEFPLLRDRGLEVTDWYVSGTVVRVEVPRDLPEGTERLVGAVWTDDATGAQTILEPQRLAEIAVTDGESGRERVCVDSRGRMERAFDVVMDESRDVVFRYWDETVRDGRTGLPLWWWTRYLARGSSGRDGAGEDADGDGIVNGDEWAADTDPADPDSVFRIVGISRTNLVWQGGHERTQVVERSGSPLAAARWVGVFTNVPPTPSRMEMVLPPDVSATNSFYRVRAF